MIKISRNSVIPESLKGPDSKAARELNRAREHVKWKPAGSFNFSIYRNNDVKESLCIIFNDKCAYCETKVSAGQSGDVEHFRPKAGVNECPSHPGYWWLAGAWSNLLLSCELCNRQRRHRSYIINEEGEGSYKLKAETVMGKESCFPTRNAVYAQGEQDNIAVEDPLLINPVQRDPTNHLRWVFFDQLSILTAETRQSNDDSYGRTSIQVFGLNRQKLVEDRSSVMLRMKAISTKMMHAFDKAARSDEQVRDALLDFAVGDLNVLKSFTDADQAYSGMATVFYKKVITELMERYENLLEGLKSAL